MTRRLGFALIGLLVACGSSPSVPDVGRSNSNIELSSWQRLFQLATALGEQRAASARYREMASRAAGTLLVPLLELGSGAALSVAGVRLRGSCGVTFVSESLAVTAAHCVDPSTHSLSGLVVETYRPSPALNSSFQATTQLSGVFPEYEHGRLGENEGYFTDRFACKLLARCSAAFGGPFNCDVSASSGGDTALLECEGRPGARVGFVDLAESDVPTAEVFMPWAHEVYDVSLDPSDDRFEHYVRFDGDRSHNYHYFGADSGGPERNQLLPLISSNGVDAAPHSKLSLSPAKVVTDLLGCHGSSGAGALQPAADGRFQLLGPFAAGDAETEAYLCDHVPALDGSSRGPGTPGIAYQPLALTQAMLAQSRSRWLATCPAFPAEATTLLLDRSCLRQALANDPTSTAFVSHLRPGLAASGLEFMRDWSLRLDPMEPISLKGFELESGATYRVGLRMLSNENCDATSCGTLALALGTEIRLSHAASRGEATFAGSFVANGSGPAVLELRADTNSVNPVAAISLKREGAVNDFDTEHERLQVSLFDLDSSPLLPWPARFVGDARAGFAARLLAHERLVFTREALVAGRRWTARFISSASATLSCGLLADDGSVAASQDCSAGLVALDDRNGSARAAFFIENRGDSPVNLDDVALASDLSPDGDADGLPDVVDSCPRGSLPAQGDLSFEVPISTRVSACIDGPQLVDLELPRAGNACESGSVRAHLLSVNGNSVRPIPFAIEGDHARLELPLGVHQVAFEFVDHAGVVLTSAKQTVEVASEIGPACCHTLQSLLQGSNGSDAFNATGNRSVCALLGDGRDFIASDGYSDVITGGEEADYLAVGSGNSVVLAGGGDDVITGAQFAHVSIYTGSGNDFVDASAADSARIYAGSGAVRILGSAGDDQVFVGAKTTWVLAGAGNDTVTLRAPCEAHPALRLDGGDGNDTLVSPLSLDELGARGVHVQGFESVVIDTTHAYLSSCFTGDEP
ncbi:MAG: calcium-binding protein [Myxococcota bacterium]